MLKRAAWLALKIEIVLFLILAAAVILTNTFLQPGPHSSSLVFVAVPAAFQFAGVAATYLLPENTHIALAGIVVFLVQYVTYGVLVLGVLSLRDRHRGGIDARQDQRPGNQG